MRSAMRLCGVAVAVLSACSSSEAVAPSDDEAGAPNGSRDAGGSVDQAASSDGFSGAPAPSDGASWDRDAGEAADASEAGDAADAETSVDDAGPTKAVEADLAYDAFTKVFYTVTNGKGYYLNNSGDTKADGWWGQAEMMEMAIDAYERNRSADYETLVTQLLYGFVAKQKADWSYNKFNDDIAWAVIANVRAHLATGNADFLTYAKSNWDKMYARGLSSDYSGGLWWTTDKTSKNACVNGPGAIGAYLLYKATGDDTYRTKAMALYAWERATLFDTATGAVYDNISSTGVTKWTFTYNTGTFIGIANYLYQETGETAYLDDAKKAADFAKAALSQSDGLIKENDITGDGSYFKAIMVRWLSKMAKDNNLGATYFPWLQYNANKAWANRRASDNLSWNDWRSGTPHVILDAGGAWATVQILQVVPPGGQSIAWYNGAPQDGRSVIEAESCDEKRVAVIEDSEGGSKQLGGVGAGAWARYENVDFSSTAPKGFRARASVDPSAGGTIEIRIDVLAGTLIGTCALTSTGGWSTYDDFTATIAPTTGTHDVYLAFKPSQGKSYVGNLNWIQLQ